MMDTPWKARLDLWQRNKPVYVVARTSDEAVVLLWNHVAFPNLVLTVLVNDRTASAWREAVSWAR